MKIFVCLVLTILFSTLSIGQITRNNWLVGGNFWYERGSASGNDATSSKTRSIEVEPNVGYFVRDKFAMGVKISARLQKEKTPRTDGSQSANQQDIYAVGPFFRYYFLHVDNRINIFSDASLSYATHTVKSTGASANTESFFQYSLQAGTVVFLNSSVGLEFLAGYNGSKYLDVDIKGQKISFRVGFQIHLENE